MKSSATSNDLSNCRRFGCALGVALGCWFGLAGDRLAQAQTDTDPVLQKLLQKAIEARVMQAAPLPDPAQQMAAGTFGPQTQANAETALQAEIRSAHSRLQKQQSYEPAELDRLAETLGRSNYLSRAIEQAIRAHSVTNLARLLDEFPGHLNSLRLNGESPVQFAVQSSGNPEILALLLAHKLDPNQKAVSGMSPLLTALENQQWTNALQLIETGAVVTNLERCVRVGPVYRSVASRSVEVVTNVQTLSPLGVWQGLAALQGLAAIGSIDPVQLQVLQALLDHGADPFASGDGDSRTSVLEDSLSQQRSAYSVGGSRGGLVGTGQMDADRTSKAVEEMILRALQERMAAAAGVDSGDISYSGFAYLEPALYGDLMLTNRPDPVRRTPCGDTALHLAVLWSRTNAIEALLAAGFSINQTNNDGLTPLQLLAGQGRETPLRSTILNSVTQRLQPTTNRVPVPGAAVSVRGLSAVRNPPSTQVYLSNQLLARGAALDVFSAAGLGLTNAVAGFLRTNPALASVRDSLGRTPLHYALAAQQQETARMLINPDAAKATTIKEVVYLRQNSVGMPAGTTPLHLVAARGDLGLIKLLLQAQAPVTARDAAGNTPLHFAARSSQSNLLALIAPARVPLDLTNNAGETPLCVAVRSANAPITELLLAAGAKPTIGIPGDPLLHIAAVYGNAEILKLLLRHGLALDGRDAQGRTAFQRAVLAENWATLSFLQAKGAAINARDSAGDTALHLVSGLQSETVRHRLDLDMWDRFKTNTLAKPGLLQRAFSQLISWKVISPAPRPVYTNTSLTSWLLEKGANPNLTNILGQTPLLVLCNQSWLATLDRNGATSATSNRLARLLDAGSRPDLGDREGVTPLEVAARDLPPGILEAMLRRAGPINRLRDVNGRTPLFAAVVSRGYALTNVNVLLNHGLSANVADKTGLTLLHFAVTNRNAWHPNDCAGIVACLVAHGADPNATDRHGVTPLQLCYSAMTNSGDNTFSPGNTMNALIQAGADPTRLDESGQTILHRWASGSALPRGGFEPDLRSWLTKHENQIDTTNAFGDTALLCATRAGQQIYVGFLLKHGADPMRRNLRGETALLLAAAKRAPDAIPDLIHPPGAHSSFYEALSGRLEGELDAWLRAEPRVAGITFNDGATPLQVAAKNWNRDVVQRLLAAGAPLDPLAAMRLDDLAGLRRALKQCTNVPSAWLFEAVQLNQLEALQALAEAGGDLGASDNNSHTLLFRSLLRGRAHISDWLQEQKATLNLPDVIVLGSTNLLEMLLATNRSQINTPCAGEPSPLLLAAGNGQADVVRVLLAHGADTTATNAHGWTALHLAAAADSADMAEALLGAGCDLNAAITYGHTALHIAAARGYTNTVRLLLQHGVDVNQPQTTRETFGQGTLPAGSTALHWAVARSGLPMVQLLIEQGAEVNAINNSGDAPLDLIPAGPPPASSARRLWAYPAPAGYFTGSGFSPRPAEIEAVLVKAGAVRAQSK